MLDLLAPIDAASLAFFDVETTGLEPLYGHRVIEVGIVRTLGGVVQGEYQQLVNPQRPSEPGALRVHGITPDMVRDAPLFAEIVDDVLALLDGAVFVGHNALFDLRFLRAELELAGRPLPPLAALDTLLLAQACWQAESYSLDNLCRALGIPKDLSHHRALGDARATQRLFAVICDSLAQSGVRTIAELFEVQGVKFDWRHVHWTRQLLEPPPVIREAMESGALLWIRYVDAQGSTSERMVRPMEVFGQRGQAYLRAFCYLRQSERTFSIERIREMHIVIDRPD